MSQVDERLRVAVDFDGTLAEFDWPRIGLQVPGARRVLLRLVHAGHLIILWTSRSGAMLEEARLYVEEVMGVPLHAVNANGPGDQWIGHPKVWADIYIDDAALGCPLRVYQVNRTPRPVVDWDEVERCLIGGGILLLQEEVGR